MDYVVNISEFQGPLDLLLHLIKQSSLAISDIKIEDITKQYLDYIKKMENMNLNIASSYLVMAAELIEMKASLLFPKPLIIDEYEEDPKDRLIKRLIEYQNYKEITSKFHDLEIDRKQYFTKEPSEFDDYEVGSNLPLDINLSDLLASFEKFLNRVEDNKPINTKITTKEYSINIRSKEIKDIIKKKKKVIFTELFEIKTKSYVIITFLSILSLAKNNEIKLEQDTNFGDILLCEVE
ncbi:MAG: segregation/condensation protein A [Bacilli bacterium]